MLGVIDPPCPFIVISLVSRDATDADLCMKHYLDVSVQDYIVGSRVADGAVAADLCICPAGDMQNGIQYVLASEKDRDVLESDLRITNRPNV